MKKTFVIPLTRTHYHEYHLRVDYGQVSLVKRELSGTSRSSVLIGDVELARDLFRKAAAELGGQNGHTSSVETATA